MRVLVEVADGRVRVSSRNENDVTTAFPELAALAGVGRDVLVDGELVAMGPDGIPTFAALADRMHVASAARARALAETNPVTLLVFDVLRLDGEDLTGRPLSERRAVLEGLEPPAGCWQVPPAYPDGKALKEITDARGLEGVVSKRLSSRYHPGQRSKDWLKFPHRPSLSYLVGGWRWETGSTSRVGAVLVGEPGPGGLLFRGRVGAGIAGKAGQQLRTLLDPLVVDASPFAAPVPRADAAGTVWVRPEVVVEVASLGFTGGGRLRQPSFLGVRRDLTAADVAAQAPQSAEPTGE